jgi:hypothetical protein
MSDSTTNATGSAPRGRRILLIVSLCLNVALVVMMLVSFVSGFGHGFRFMLFSPRQLMAQTSDDGERSRIQAIMEMHRAKIAALEKASRQAHQHALDVFEATPYSKSDMAAAFDGIRKADEDLRDESAKASIDAIAVLSPAERKTIGEKMRRRARWWTWFGHRH